ncbi:MAG: hypothetical protein IPK81_09650 [Rhodospirillales bacterium]|nr:MAG: hypothetical protein IPK81_09650 [Rhodospirillales bacterium]
MAHRQIWLALALACAAPGGKAQNLDPFVPDEFPKRISSEVASASFAKVPVVRFQGEIRWFTIHDKRASSMERTCFTIALEELLRSYFRYSNTRLVFVTSAADANFLFNTDTTDEGFAALIRSKVPDPSKYSLGFLSSEGKFHERDRQRIEASRPLYNRPDKAVIEDWDRVHSAFFAKSDGQIDIAYVWRRDWTTTGLYPHYGVQNSPYGYAPRSPGCYGADRSVSRFKSYIAFALGAAIWPRMEGVVADYWDHTINVIEFYPLLVRLLYHPEVETGKSGEALRLTISRVLARERASR